MALTSGERIGVYEIVELIGAGGMGEVYRSRDTRLKRDVAVKVLPESLSQDADRLARFQREAEVLAALNHPNIAAIYGIEHTGTTNALVLELVEGDTLEALIAHGGLSLDELVPIAKQIAEALETAHERGVIHRDLKPANVKVAPDGHVKVLDFGLAKLLDSAPAAAQGLSMSPTLSVHATHAGVILGTAAYMSPEQARGKAVDRRADIWAFGCVLFEMLTGRRAFDGETVAETIGAVIHKEPDWTALPPSVPEWTRRLLARCLQKDPRRRLPHIGVARLELEDPPPDPPAAGRQRRTLATRERLVWATLLVAALGLAAASAMRARQSAPALPEMRLEIPTLPTSDPLGLAVAPDGDAVVFLANVEGRSRLWLRPMNGTPERPLDRTDRASFPFWSPDGRALGFFADGRLKRIDIATGFVQELADAPQARGGTWGPDGTILYTPNTGGPVFRVNAAGGAAVVVTRLEDGALNHRSPYFLPDGRHFLYYSLGPGEIHVGDVDGSAPKVLLSGIESGPTYTGSGYVLYARQRALFAQRFDPARLELMGEPSLIAQQVLSGPNIAAVATSRSGVIAYRTGSRAGLRQLTWVDRSGKTLMKVGDSNPFLDPAMSPNSTMVAVRRDVDGRGGVWLVDLNTGALKEFTARGSFAVWSPDGSRIVFAANAPNGQVNDLFIKPVTGAGREELLLQTPQIKAGTDWSRDGRFLVYRMLSPQSSNDLFAFSIGDRRSTPVVQTPADDREGQISPDGRWLAFVSNESGRHEIYVQPFPGAGPKISISSDGGGQPRWRPDGKELFYIAPDGRLMAVAIDESNGTLRGSAPVPLFTANVGNDVQANNRQQYVVSSDGSRFLLNTIVEDAASSITVLLNWRGEDQTD